MRRRSVMVKMEGRQYISTFYFSYKNCLQSMKRASCIMSVRQRGTGPEAREKAIGVWRVKELKPKAYLRHSIAPGTFRTYYENQKAK